MTEDLDQEYSLLESEPAAPKPTPAVRYVFSCGSAGVPCKLTYEYDNGPQPREQHKLAAPARTIS